MTLSFRNVGICAVAALLSGLGNAQPQDDSATVKDFQQRVNKYVSLKKEQNLSNRQTSSPDQLVEQKRQAAQKIRDSRPAAQQGDIFSPTIGTYFKKQIELTLEGASGRKVRTSLRHAEPLPAVNLKVNAKYPKGLPLQSTPPSLLKNLPPLPDGLQYRIAGPTLILYDVPSGLVVDLLPDAIPGG